MHPYTKYILDEIDRVIKEQQNCGAFDFPIDIPEHDGDVTPIWSTFDDRYGLVFILKITPENRESVYVSVTQGDGGVTISRSQLSGDEKTLMFDSNEMWSEL